MAIKKNIYCIIDLETYKLNDIINDLKDEGYQHNFLFGNYHEMNEDAKRLQMRKCSEIWIFGDCQNVLDYKIAKELGADLWVMK